MVDQSLDLPMYILYFCEFYYHLNSAEVAWNKLWDSSLVIFIITVSAGSILVFHWMIDFFKFFNLTIWFGSMQSLLGVRQFCSF